MSAWTGARRLVNRTTGQTGPVTDASRDPAGASASPPDGADPPAPVTGESAAPAVTPGASLSETAVSDPAASSAAVSDAAVSDAAAGSVTAGPDGAGPDGAGPGTAGSSVVGAPGSEVAPAGAGDAGDEAGPPDVRETSTPFDPDLRADARRSLNPLDQTVFGVLSIVGMMGVAVGTVMTVESHGHFPYVLIGGFVSGVGSLVYLSRRYRALQHERIRREPS
jgi:hypothetical protein